MYIGIYVYIYNRPTQWMIRVHFRVARFQKKVILSLSTNIPIWCDASDPPHNFILYWFCYSSRLADSFAPDQYDWVEMFCTT